MQIVTKFTVTVDGTKFVFKKPSAKTLMGFSKEAAIENIQKIFEGLIEVHGLLDEDGKEIPAETVKTLDLPFDVILKIMEGWNEAVAVLQGPRAAKSPEKKESTTISEPSSNPDSQTQT